MKWRDRAQRVVFDALQAQCGAYADVAWGPPTIPREQVPEAVVVRCQWLADIVASRSTHGGQVVDSVAACTLTISAAAGEVVALRSRRAMPTSGRIVATGDPTADAAALAADLELWLGVTATPGVGTVDIVAPPDALWSPLVTGCSLSGILYHAPMLVQSVRYSAGAQIEAWSVDREIDARDVLGDCERALARASTVDAAWIRGVAINAVGDLRSDASAYLSGGEWETRARSVATLHHIEVTAELIDTITSATVEAQAELE